MNNTTASVPSETGETMHQHLHIPAQDMKAVERLRNKILDVCLESKLSTLECASAVSSVLEGLTELIREQTGGEVVKVED